MSDIKKRVTAIQGNPVSKVDPTTGQILEWNGYEWKPTDLPTTLPPDGYAGGDLSGSYPDPSVIALQGNPVSSAPPTTGQFLNWNGSQWVPTTLTMPSSLPPNGPAGGDISGTYPNPIVVALQGNGVSPTTPTDGYVLTYDATDSAWEPKPSSGMTGLRYQVFTEDGYWTAPDGVSCVMLVGFGGGGSGGSSAGGTGGGGGGGSLQSTTMVIVTPGTQYAVIIGAGGSGVLSSDGNPGGDTSFGSLVTFGGASGGTGPGVAFSVPGGVGGQSVKSQNGGNALDSTSYGSPLAHPACGGSGNSSGPGTSGGLNPIGGFPAGNGGQADTSEEQNVAGGGGGGGGPNGAGTDGGNGSNSGTAGTSTDASPNSGAGTGGSGSTNSGTPGGSGNGGSGQLTIIW